MYSKIVYAIQHPIVENLLGGYHPGAETNWSDRTRKVVFSAHVYNDKGLCCREEKGIEEKATSSA